MRILKQITYVTVSIILLFLSACSGGNVVAPSATQPSLEDLPQAAVDAQSWLANELGVTVEQTRIVSVEQTDWSDSCLGLGTAEESCLQAITPGWKVIVEVNGQQREVRASEDGSVIRLVPE